MKPITLALLLFLCGCAKETPQPKENKSRVVYFLAKGNNGVVTLNRYNSSEYTLSVDGQLLLPGAIYKGQSAWMEYHNPNPKTVATISIGLDSTGYSKSGELKSVQAFKQDTGSVLRIDWTVQ